MKHKPAFVVIAFDGWLVLCDKASSGRTPLPNIFKLAELCNTRWTVISYYQKL